MDEIVLDHVADKNGVELYRLSRLYEFPEFVKKANLESVMSPGSQPATVYADPRGHDKLYPCQDPASTWLSCLYFEEKQGNYRNVNDRRRVRERLDKSAEYWGIKEDVEAMREKHAGMNKNADDLLPDSDFGYVRVLETGHKERHWRMKNAKEVQAAAKALCDYRDRLPFPDRHVISGKILQKAAQYGASLGDYESFVERQAGLGVCDPAAVVVMLRNRATITKESQHRQTIHGLAEIVASKPSASLMPEMLVKLAETVDMIDRANKLVDYDQGTSRYTDVLPRPEDVIFSVTYKEASAGVGVACALTTGTIYDRTQFSKVSADDLASLFGPDIVDQVTVGLDVNPEKLAELAETLPRGDAELFEQLLQETGIPPMAHKAASHSAGLSKTILASVAKNYRQPA